VTDLTGLTARQWSVGVVPEGSIRLDRVSCAAYTEDELRGLKIPTFVGLDSQPPSLREHGGPGGEVQFSPTTDFFYEIVEDGRGDDPAARRRFRLLGQPYRAAGRVEWVVALQRADRDNQRNGRPPVVGR
jgi:hypothetical protein